MQESFETKNILIKKASSELSIENLLDELRKFNSNKSVMQIFDTNAVINRMHLIAAYVNTITAFKNKTNKTKTKSIEMLLFAAMTDQIAKAIEIAGAKDNSNFIIFSDTMQNLNKVKNIVKIGSDFNASMDEIQKASKILGIEFKKKDMQSINLKILEKMALSRFGSD